MNINGVGSTGSVNGADIVGAVGQTGADSIVRQSSVPPPASAATATISKPGELFAKLQQLQQQDPAKFEEVASGIADSLRSAGQQGSGSGGGFLDKLADRFDQAAQTGDLSALAPPQARSADGASGQHHHHHGHHGGGGGAIASVFENALTQVNQALSAVNGTSSTAAATATDVASPSSATPT